MVQLTESMLKHFLFLNLGEYVHAAAGCGSAETGIPPGSPYPSVISHVGETTFPGALEITSIHDLSYF